MLQKLARLKYEHLESVSSMEVIDKAYNRTEDAVLDLFPSSIRQAIFSGLAVIGTLYLFGMVRWWLTLVVLLPFILETWLRQKFSHDIYNEMETYWQAERSYGALGNMLRSRDFIKENYLLNASDYLIGTYRSRLNAQNREYERFYFKHLRRNFTKNNITKIAQFGCAALLFMLYVNGEVNIGLMISLTLSVFTSLFGNLNSFTQILRNSGKYANTFSFYDQYFALTEDDYGDADAFPDNFSIEFKDVYFTYPGTEKQILKGMSFNIRHGEKVSIVGANGEGKSTMVKLLLGLFQPDSGEILIGGKPLSDYSQSVKKRLFGPVFQDFIKYSITLRENIGVGEVEKMNDKQILSAAMVKAKVDLFANDLTDGAQTLLGRDFEGGVDISGGQWQRVAMARAFMGDKPILILDEPTSQLDPMAESQIYSEFAEISSGKSSLFITHRLGSTMITDRIYVIADGRVVQNGTHAELVEKGGLYADMWGAQKQWYIKNGTGEN